MHLATLFMPFVVATINDDLTAIGRAPIQICGTNMTACPESQICLNKENQVCDMMATGEEEDDDDCQGVCVDSQCPDGQGVSYVSTNLNVCLARKFSCNAGQDQFVAASCGCGCKPSVCGTLAGIACPAGFQCVDDPSDTCDPKQGGADCSGLCEPSCPQGRGVEYVSRNIQTCARSLFACQPWQQPFSNKFCGCGCESRICGGKRGLQCAQGGVCVDNPEDSCDPENGGVDCIGICVAAEKCPTDGVSNTTFTSTDTSECARIRIRCESGFVPFSDECGCGCKRGPSPPPPETTKKPTMRPKNDKKCPVGFRLISDEYPRCKTFRFACPENSRRFNKRGCGCGCLFRCPRGKSVKYTEENPSLCTKVPECPKDRIGFKSACGCGCKKRPPHCPRGRRVRYVTPVPFPQCKEVRFACQNGEKRFQRKGCGCGCRQKRKPKCRKGRKGFRFVARNEQRCKTIKFECARGETRFSNRCGCGCRPISCPAGGEVRYLSADRQRCREMRFKCAPGFRPFRGKCGCGCKPRACPRGRRVEYKSRDPEVCATLRFFCPRNKAYFSSDSCGCGCRPQFWSRFVGKKCKRAKRVIERRHPGLNVLCIPEGTPVTRDRRFNRVRIFHDEDMIVTQTPRVG